MSLLAALTLQKASGASCQHPSNVSWAQAMVATALGLPPTYFRRMLQSNAATTVIDLQPNGSGPPTATLNRLNQACPP